MTPAFRNFDVHPSPKKKKKGTVKPGDAFENATFERWFEILESQTGLS
jgi:hypothetical protein